MSDRHTAHLIARKLTDWLPEALRHQENFGRENVQIIVWLVGLSSALITLIAANREVSAAIGTSGRSWLIGLLVFVVLFGVSHRIVYGQAENRQKKLVFGLRGLLWGATLDFSQPEPLAEEWTIPDIVRELKESFDLDYRFLLNSPTASHEHARSAYAAHYELWSRHDREGLECWGLQWARMSAKRKRKARPFPGARR